MYSNEWDRKGWILRDRFHEMKRALRQADREMRHALKNSLTHDNSQVLYECLAGKLERSGPATVEDCISEIDGSLSYLEELPRQKIVPYEEVLAKTGDHMVKLKESLKK